MLPRPGILLRLALVLAMLRYLLPKLFARLVRDRLLAAHFAIPLPEFESAFPLGELGMLGAMTSTLLSRVRAYQNLPSCTLMYKECQLGLLSAVVSTNPSHVPLLAELDKSSFLVVIGQFIGHEAVLFQNGERGKRDRNRLNLAFAADRLQEDLFPMMLEGANELQHRLLNKTEFDAGEEFSKTTFDLITKGSFGTSIESNREGVMRLMEMGLNPMAYLPFGVPLLQWWHSGLLNAIQQTIDSIIDTFKPQPSKDLLGVMMALDSTNEIEGVAKKTWMAHNLRLFMFAGMDTTTSALQFCSALLAKYPEYQLKIHQEIHEIVGGVNEELTYAHLAQLRLTEAVIKESLRLYPPGIAVARDSGLEERVVDGVRLPKGTTFVLDVLNMHRRADLFSNPNAFVPERWLGEKETVNERAFMPFSSGSRSCVGKKFAMMEIKTIFAVLLRGNYKLHACYDTKPMPDATALKGIITPTTPITLTYS